MKRISAFLQPLVAFLLSFSVIFALFSCSGGDDTESNPHTHSYVNGACECGEADPGYDGSVPCPSCITGRCRVAEETAPTALREGKLMYLCDACSHSFEEMIPATKSIKILLIGDNSTLGETAYLDPILREAGVESVLIATLNHNVSKGAAIDSQWSNIESNKKAYTLMTQLDGKRSYAYSRRFSEGLAAEDWDFIVIGQSVTLGGDAESFYHLGDYISHIKDNSTNPNMRLLWNMSWALSDSSTLEDFAIYDNSRNKMFDSIVSALRTFVLTNDLIDGVVPVGVAIENLRATPLGDSWTDSGILLGGSSGDGGAYAASLLLSAEVLGVELDSLTYSPDAKERREANIYSMAKEAAKLASKKTYQREAPECKSMKLLIMGNSYGNDAMAYFEKILHDAGYINVVIGHMGESAMAINDHYHNIDDDPTNDYIYKSTGKTFSVHYKTVNGIRVELEADYKKIIANEDWDIITFYQGPNSMDTLIKESYYSELNNLLLAIKANMTNPDGKIIYYMPWIHGETNTAGYYGELSALTQKLFIGNELIDGIIPAGTVIQNLRTSYLSSATDGTGDINRDWGHLNYGVGRYAVALTFYAYLTGGDINGISYIPTKEEAALPFTDPALHLDVIKEAIENALGSPFDITPSVYKEKQ